MTRPRPADDDTSSRTAVLRVIQADCSRPHKDLAQEADVSPVTFSKVLTAAELDGTIRATVSILDRNKLGFQALGFFKIVCSHFRHTEAVADALKDYPGVQELHVMDGTHYLLAKICAKTCADLSRIQDYIVKLAGVEAVRVQVAMRTILETTRVPI
jgi:DNA-binding Lrp family transcriptional regulator